MSIKTLSDGTEYIKAHAHDWEDSTKSIKGKCTIYRKIDGVRALRLANGTVVSRESKPLYNLDKLDFQDAEIYSLDWNTSVSLVRTQAPQVITQDMVYDLRDGSIDKRLYLGVATDPSNANLEKLMNERLALGDEGLIVRTVDKKGGIVWWKIVPYKYADVRITGFKEGTGRLKGTLGSIQTTQGSVGTGFDDALRNKLWSERNDLIGKIIQVKYRETTDAGKMRFPSYERMRWDKTEESLD
ncbi:hypothetical protein I6H07_06210 [Hafnia alvei]|nr:hypothetical protein [Hafnia alvei]MBI0275428.1 hypothetical protein [Hafnia alvei]PNK98578.1 hypothetical protein CEQ28_013785 [Hafnia alvei]